MNIKPLIDKIVKSASMYPSGIFQAKGKIVTCVNPYSYLILRKNSKLYERFDGVFVDGILMCIFIRLLWLKKVPRLSFDMVGMAKDLFERLNHTDESLYIIGAKQDELDKCVYHVKDAYSGIKMAGCRNGYFSGEKERDYVINEIVSLSPDFVIVGMGTPLQDDFAVRLKNAGYNGVVFTCGGFIRQTSNDINYYPEWVNRYNLRGFYRQYKEKGIFRRNIDTLLIFPLLFTYDTLNSKLIKFR